jgi:hypothetical protein
MTQPFVVQIYGKEFHPKNEINVEIKGKVYLQQAMKAQRASVGIAIQIYSFFNFLSLTFRTLPKIILLFYVLFVLCCYVHSLCVMYTGLLPPGGNRIAV